MRLFFLQQKKNNVITMVETGVFQGAKEHWTA
jgi:hypothetical protein